MELSAIRIEGIRNIGSFELRLSHQAPVVITGSAGSGKTSILEAVLTAKQAFRPGAIEPEPGAWLGDGRRAGMVELEWKLAETERAYAKVDAETVVTRWGVGSPSTGASLRLRELIERTPLAYFDQARHLGQQSAQPFPGPRLQGLRGPSKYDWIEKRLVDLADEEARRTVAHLEERGLALASRDLGALRGFDTTLQNLCPRLRWGGIKRVDDRSKALFVRSSGQASTLEALSDSERMAILLAAALDAVPVEGAIILIDSPELGQHPSDHAGVFDTLTRVIPRTQWIAASTSAGILRAMPREQVVVLSP